MANAIITLTTDFGLRDPYVAEMKAVILSINPNATIVDITHEIEKFNIRMGAHILASAAPYFPLSTIHVAVIDPEVGTRRRPLLIESDNCCFLGPDNGVLVLAAKRLGIKHVYEVSNRDFMRSKISNTFHGRDIFAPAAAFLSKGVSPKKFGPEVDIDEIVTLSFAEVTRKGENMVGEVLHVDNFGNIITNFGERELKAAGKGFLNVSIGGIDLKLKLCKSYADGEAGKPLAILGSHDFLEIALNQDSAAEKFKVKIGDKVILRTYDKRHA